MYTTKRRFAVMMVAIVAMSLVCRWAPAGKQPPAGISQALQRMADQQGHPQAAAQQLKNLGYAVPPDVEAAAAGVKADDVGKAIEKGGSLSSRLEAVRGKPLSADETQQVAEAQRDYSRQMASYRRKLAQDIARTLDLPELKVRKIFARDTGTPAGQKKSIAELERLAGHRLSAGDANRVAAARGELYSAAQSQRDVLAEQVGKTMRLPPSVVRDLLP